MLLAVGGVSCDQDPADAPRRAGSPVSSSSSSAPDPAAGGAARSSTSPTASPAIAEPLRAHDVETERLKARVIYAHRVEAKSGSVGQVLPPLTAAALGVELAKQDLHEPEVTADVLYAHDVKAAWIEAQLVYVEELKLPEPPR